jgi:hypothetical protein
MRTLIIVARDEPELWQSLKAQFAADETVEVILDRRLRERRQRIQACEPDRRGADHRLWRIETDLRSRRYVIVGPQPRTLFS